MEEREPTTAEILAALLSNDGARYALVGSINEAQEGRAMIFDKVSRAWIRITSEDGADTLHRDTVVKMLNNGTPVEASTPKP